MKRNYKSVAIGVAALLVPGILTACGSTPPPVKHATSGVAPSKSPESQAGAEQAVAAYRDMWTDAEAAATTADSSSPRLADHATGAALRLLRYGLSKDRQEGVVAKGSLLLSPEVADAQPPGSPTRVDIRDCSDDSHWLLYKPDGSLKDNVPGGHFATTATVQLISGRWLVKRFYMGAVGSC